MKKAKSKKQPTHKLITEILHPKEILNVDFNLSVLQAFYKFSIEYKHENFEDVIRVVLGEESITSNLNAFCTSSDGLMSKPVFDNSQISIEKLLIIYKWLIIHNKDQITQFENSQEKIEEWCLSGDVESIESEIELIYSIYGDSFWLINMRLLVAYLKNDRDFLENAHEEYKNNDSYILKDIVARKSWLFQLHDTTTYVENITTRTIGELKDGLATDYAAIYALSLTKYPLYDEVKTFHSVYELQKFPLIDIYMFLCESVSQSIKSEVVLENIKTDNSDINIPHIFFEMAELADLKRLKRTLSILDNSFTRPDFDNEDKDIKNYIKGKYNLIIDNFENSFDKVNFKISKVNILAKSYIKEGRLPHSNIPIVMYNVIVNLIKIYKMENVNESISNIISLATKLNFLEISDHLLISVVKSAPYYLNNKLVKIIELGTHEFSTPVTPLSSKVSLSPLEKVGIINNELTDNRQLKLRRELAILYNSHKSEVERSGVILSQLKDLIPIEKDYLEIEFDYYLKKEMFSELISLAADSLIKNHQSVICVPMEELCSLIQSGEYTSIDSVIVAHFHNNNTKKQDETLLNESFEDYIISEDDLRPSEILSGKKSLSEKEIYFFNEICHPQLMAYIGCYSDSYDLLMERIKILTILKSKFDIDEPNLEKEVMDIIDDIIIESGASKLSNAKIHVDIKHLINKKKNDIRSLIKLYHEEDDDSDLVEIDKGGLPTSSKDKVIHKIINSLMIEFLDNNDVGLDKNLSSEIKHGFFSDLISSKFNEHNITTELDLEGNYKPNDYWLKYYEIVSPKLMSAIDQSLNSFTSNLHKLIEEAESWMKVSWDSSHPERVFSFVSVSYDEFVEVKQLVIQNKTPDEIGELVYAIMLELLDQKLNIMKDKLNGDFSGQLDKLIATLLDEIDRIKGTAALNDLTIAINTVRNGVKEDIKTASEWFSLSNDKDLPSLSLSKVIKIGERCFSKFTKHKPNIVITDNCDTDIDGKHISSIVFTLINTLNNACKYGIGNTIYIESTSLPNLGFTIEIANDINQVKEKVLKGGGLSDLTRKLDDLKRTDLLRTQGGTGLYRSLHELRLCSSQFNLVPYIASNKFIVKVSYDEKNTNSGR